MRRPDKVSVPAIGKPRKDRPRQPWIVRWTVNGREASKSFPTKAAAEDWRARILIASRDGLRFDRATGLPSEWTGSTDTFAAHCATYVQAQADWAPRSRRSAVEALSRAIPLMVPARAPAPPANIRTYLTGYLTGTLESADATCDAWLRRWSTPLADLTGELVGHVRDRLGVRDDGQLCKPTTAARYRSTTHAVLRDAVEKEKLARDPWPDSSKSKKRKRRAVKVKRQIDVSRLPSQEQVRQILAAIPTRKSGSRNYWLLSQICWHVGTRPSEALVLDASDFTLPEEGWGKVTVERAADGEGGVGETKTGDARTVPVSPELVAIIREWLDGRTDGPLVRTTGDTIPDLGNWGRALDRACDQLNLPRVNPYDFRHCCATTMLNAGVPLGEAARRLGHTIETLLSHYAGIMVGDEQSANERIEAAYKA